MVLFFTFKHIIKLKPLFFLISPLIFSFILQILSFVVFCLLLGGEGKKKTPNQNNKTENLVGKMHKGFIMSQYFQFTLHISLSPKGINTAY